MPKDSASGKQLKDLSNQRLTEIIGGELKTINDWFNRNIASKEATPFLVSQLADETHYSVKRLYAIVEELSQRLK